MLDVSSVPRMGIGLLNLILRQAQPPVRQSLNRPIALKSKRVAQIRGLRVNLLPSVPRMIPGAKQGRISRMATLSLLIWKGKIAPIPSTNLDATGVLSLESQLTLMLLTFKPLTPRVPKEPKAKVRKAKVRRAKAKAKAKGEVTKAKEKVKVTLIHTKKVRGKRKPTAKLEIAGHDGQTILAKTTTTSVDGAVMQLAQTGVHVSIRSMDHLTTSTNTQKSSESQ